MDPFESHGERKRAQRIARRKRAFVKAQKARDEQSRVIWERIKVHAANQEQRMIDMTGRPIPTNLNWVVVFDGKIISGHRHPSTARIAADAHSDSCDVLTQGGYPLHIGQAVMNVHGVAVPVG